MFAGSLKSTGIKNTGWEKSNTEAALTAQVEVYEGMPQITGS